MVPEHVEGIILDDTHVHRLMVCTALRMRSYKAPAEQISRMRAARRELHCSWTKAATWIIHPAVSLHRPVCVWFRFRRFVCRYIFSDLCVVTSRGRRIQAARASGLLRPVGGTGMGGMRPV